jgi:RNA polymerase sigma-70 factor (ECF subfamily)
MDDERASAVAPSDEEILAALAQHPDDFSLLYRRHVRGLLGYLLRRTGDPELAADLCAETFAAALDGARRFDPARGPAVGWLYGIARRLLHRAQRRGAVEDTARRRLGMAPLALSDAALERIERVAGSEVAIAEALATLPEDQRTAVTARVVDERGYDEIAAKARTSQSVIRKRVSRGLAGMRTRLEEEL